MYSKLLKISISRSFVFNTHKEYLSYVVRTVPSDKSLIVAFLLASPAPITRLDFVFLPRCFSEIL